MKNVLMSILIILNTINLFECLQNDSNRNYTEGWIKFLNGKISNFRSLNDDNKNLTIPLKEIDNKLYIDVNLGTPGQSFSLLVDTGSFSSIIFKKKFQSDNTNKNELNFYDEKLSSTYQSFGKYEKIGRKYVDYQTIDEKEGIASYEKIKLPEKEIDNYGFILTDNLYEGINENVPQNLNLGGILSLSRDNTYHGGELFNLVRQLKMKDYINNEDFIIRRKNNTLISFGNVNFDNEEKAKSSFCNLFEYDTFLSTVWACNISHFSFHNYDTNYQINLDNLFFNNNFIVNSFTIFDTSADNILIPFNAQIGIIKNITNDYNETISHIEYEKIVDYFNNTLFKNKPYCKLQQIDSQKYIRGFLNVFVCNSTLNDKEEFLKTFEFLEFYFILNGYGYAIKLNDLFSKSDKNITQYLFNLNFYYPKENEHSFWVMGNLFLKQFEAIGFFKSQKQINFYGGNFYNFTNYTGDVKEEQPIFTSFVVSLFIVIVLILFVLLVPYMIYRQRKRAMMEKLQYDVIYKKMDDITRELTK